MSSTWALGRLIDLPLCLSETPGLAGERLGAKERQPGPTPILTRAIGTPGQQRVLELYPLGSQAGRLIDLARAHIRRRHIDEAVSALL